MIRLRRKTVLIAVFLLVSVGSGAAVSVEYSAGNTTVQPGTTAAVGNYTVTAQNETVELTDVSVDTRFSAFDPDFRPANVSLNATCMNTTCPVDARNVSAAVTVPPDIAPGAYDGTASFVFAEQPTVTQPISVTVPRVYNYTIANMTQTTNVSVESNPTIARFRIQNTGNVNTTLRLNTTGNISQYLTYKPSVTVYPGLDASIVVGAGVPRDTPFGTYRGRLHIRGDRINRTVNLSTRIVDTIDPTIRDVTVPDFQATKPEQFTVEARDNLKVATVNATVIYEDQIVENNETVTVNKTLEQLAYERRPNTNIWEVEPPAHRRGDYYLNGAVADASGNAVRFTRRFSVTGLNVTHVLTNKTLRPRYVDDTAQTTIGEIEKETKVTVRLEYFDQPLEGSNETWKVGVVTPSSGERRFASINDTVALDEPGPIRLYIESDTAESYYGELSFSGVQQHVPINDFTFNSRFSDDPVPERQVLDVYNTTHTCEPSVSDVVTDAGWKCEYFVPVTAISAGSDLANELQAVTPKSAEQQEELWQHRIDAAQDKLTFALIGNAVQVLLVLSLSYIVYYAFRVAPYMNVAMIEDTQD